MRYFAHHDYRNRKQVRAVIGTVPKRRDKWHSLSSISELRRLWLISSLLPVR